MSAARAGAPNAEALGTTRPRRRVPYALRRLRRSRLAIAGLVVLSLVLLFGAGAPLVAPHSPTDQGLERRLKPPAWQPGADDGYVLATDHLGRDMLSRLIWGARIYLLVGVSAVE